MRATAKLLGWCVAVGLTLSVSSVQAGQHPLVSGTQISWMATGQLASGSNSENRRLAEQWLRQAREAMEQDNLQLAEYYVERAEKLNVKYDPILGRFKDTPAKVRKDLEAKREAGGDAAAKPRTAMSKLFPKKDGAAPPSDTYGGAPAGSSLSDSNAFPVASNNATSGRGAFPAPAAGAATSGHKPDMILLAARHALAQGDANKATLLTGQVKQMGLTYPLHADSPEKVEVLIRKAQGFAVGPGPQTDAATYTREFAQFLMDQAMGLMQYKAFEDAQRLAQQAKDLRAKYGQFDRTPDQVLAQVQAARQQAGQTLAADGTPLMSLTDQGGATRRLPPAAAMDKKAHAMQLVTQARVALDRGDLITAKRMAEAAQMLKVPDTAFAANDTRPWEVLLEVNKALKMRGGVMAAGHFESQNALATDAGKPDSYPVSQGLYDPSADSSKTVAAQATEPSPAIANTPPSAGEGLFQDGLRALENRDRATAMKKFQEAWKYEQELDPQVRQRLQDKLILLQANTAPPAGGTQPSPLEAVDAKQQLLRQKLYREITSERAEAEKQSVENPKGALDRLVALRDRVNESEVDPGSKKQLLTLVDRNIDSLQQYMETNRSDIELADRNREVLEGVALDSQRRVEIRNKIAELVDQFNTLVDEQRYAEAEMLAKQARELDPNSDVVQNLMWKSRFLRRIQEQLAIDEKKEQGFYDQLTAVNRSSVPFNDDNPFQFGEATAWRDLSRGRGALLEQQRRRLTEAEMEIQNALKNKVDVKFTERPLSEVMDMLSELSGVPIVLDPVGLAAEGVTTDTPVTIRLNQQISLQSALNLVLEPLRLSYVIQNEVLQITSEQQRDSNTFHKVYNVADLVIPIPNFVPGYNIGLPGALQYAHNTLGYGNNMAPLGRMPLTVASNDTGGTTNASVLAQMGASGMLPSGVSQPPQPMGFGPGGMGGAAMADFDTLIELITSTIAPDTWDEVGGAGAIEPFPTNLSLVISQTQDVHEQIADLLDQLRRLQDLQVTIEVRFITLNDNFFERIGIDFDFSIDDNVNPDVIRDADRPGGLGDDNGPTVVFGLTEQGPTQTLDLDFTQGSFSATVPQFGAFDPASAANFGFAILSDIEVFFLLQAAEGDNRSNVLQAPKVTLFNGQTASVSDVSQRPFVTSIIPVVGDFAAAQQPVIVVLSEGTSMSVQAVVSSDRRFVRLTLVPFFSRIGPVEEFTFEGRTTSDSGSIVTDPEGEQSGRDNQVISREGTTVQLPTFIFTTVSTTVSVPDGGTVLLGGIKRLSEGRTERGVPMLSKLPYVNRLFKNVSIGRETQSLMMMVTPRIIIQEEEELAQTGYDSSQ